ncbi:MAG: PD-(D/E)XK nuclease family protein [Hydrococcus sp. RM1_1_31]|nr:PD-(D/E)XK nuclease family protein [Hydrococcus sp. RM1_1_31]
MAKKQNVNSVELYYEFENVHQLLSETETQLLLALTNFVESPTFNSLRTVFSQSQAFVEKGISVKERNLSFGGKIDFAYEDKNKLNIVDWKLGGTSESQDTLQLISYALLVSEEFGYAPGRIDLHQAHLASNQISSFCIGENDLLRSKISLFKT